MPLGREERVRLSKKMAGLLRHYPDRYGLRVDREGWARIDDLVRALHRIPGYSWVRREHVLEVAMLDEKGRYEVRGERIRARYGHSIQVDPGYEELSRPPPTLYHGTTMRRLPSIRRRGLLPMKRRMVHLSLTPSDALETGRRHGPDVVILEVDVECMRRRGIPLYRAGPRVVTTPHVPPDCIRRAITP